MHTPKELSAKEMVEVALGVSVRVCMSLGVESCSREAVSGELLLFVIRSILWKQALQRGL